ncbi:MAG: hypothetical protein P8J32_06870 [bacterium]|nr:hypothetical protein [bacterium]
MDILADFTGFEYVVILGTLIGGWVKFHGDYNRLSARVRVLETDNKDYAADIKQMMADIQEIKLLLAKNQMQ